MLVLCNFPSEKIFSPKLGKLKRVGTTLIEKWVSSRLGVPRPPTLKTIVS
jgi:hypothetical protein